MFRFIDNLFSKVRRNILYQYLLTYILILVLPFIIGCFYYQQTLTIMTKNSYSENKTLLEQMAFNVNKRIDEVSSISQQLILNNAITSFQYVKNPFEYPNSYQVNKTQMELSNYVIANDFIENYFVLFNNNDLVLNSQIAYPYQDFYRLYFSDAFQSYDVWYETFTTTTAPFAKKITLSGIAPAYIQQPLKSGDYIFFCTPFCSYGKVNGTVIVTVKEENLLDLLNSDTFSNGGFFYMSSIDNEVLVSTASEESQVDQTQDFLLSIEEDTPSVEAIITNQKMIITQIEPPDSTYRYVAAQPQKLVLSKANSLRLILLTILLISIVLSVVISYILAKRNYKPLKQMLYHILPEDTESDLFEAVKGSFTFLSANNSNMQKALEQQLDILHQVFLGRLINRDLMSEEDIYNMCRCLNFSYQGKWFAILLFQFDFNVKPGDQIDLTILTSMVDMTKEIISQQYVRPYFYQPREQDLVLLLDDDSKESLLQRANEIVDLIKADCPKQIFENMIITGSSLTDNLLNISECFKETHLTFQLITYDMKSSILWYQSSMLNEKVYRFSLEDKRRLIYHTKSGNIEVVREILHQIFTVNLVEQPISVGLHKILLNDLISSLLQCLSEVNLTPQINETLLQQIESLSSKSELSQIRFINETFFYLCDYTKQNSLEMHSQIIDKVMAYLKENYCLADLSLSFLGSKFNINESYLSYLFKQNNNQTFSAYVEQLRLDRAKLLLMQTTKNVTEIAAEIGYLSANSFCRAFKRATGLTTTEFRNSNRS